MRATERLRIASGDVPCLRSLLRGRRRRAMAGAFLAECNREDVARAHTREALAGQQSLARATRAIRASCGRHRASPQERKYVSQQGLSQAVIPV